MANWRSRPMKSGSGWSARRMAFARRHCPRMCASAWPGARTPKMNRNEVMTKDKVLLVGQKGAISHLTLSRPDKRNALNDDLVAALDGFFDAVPDETRAIVVSGAGGHFSSGLDLSQHVARQPLDVM